MIKLKNTPICPNCGKAMQFKEDLNQMNDNIGSYICCCAPDMEIYFEDGGWNAYVEGSAFDMIFHPQIQQEALPVEENYKVNTHIEQGEEVIDAIVHKGNYWVDGNNNRWAVNYFSKEEAEEESLSMVRCTNCIDCKTCEDCTNCEGCEDCRDCNGCSFCKECVCCIKCHECNGCKFCFSCLDCKMCESIKFCEDCSAVVNIVGVGANGKCSFIRYIGP